jgi:4-hydroxy-3-methylbut-2-enyl diphosphate reductase
VELCERKFDTYFISSAQEIESENEISHFNYHNKKMCVTQNWLNTKKSIKIILTSGASCPDSAVDEVLDKVLSYFENVKSKESVLQQMSV